MVFSIQYSPGLIGRMARKELREILRDRRTIITLVLMPVLLYPLLSVAFRQYFMAIEKPATTVIFRVGVVNEAEALLFYELLNAGRPEADAADPMKQFPMFPSQNLEADVRAENVELGVRLRSQSRQGTSWDLIVRADSPLGKKAFAQVETRLLLANVRALQQRLGNAGQRTSLPVSAEVHELPAPEARKTSALSSLVPLILVLMTITGAVYPSIDLTAGERERGTLEILMAAPVPRINLLLAKYIAVLTVALLTAMVNLTMMTTTVLASGLGALVFGDGGLSLATLIAVIGLLMLFAAFFSAVLLAVTSFARSFKEAQAYLIPLMLLSLSPGIMTLLPGIRLGGLLNIVPLLNVVLLAREILEGPVRVGDAAIVVASTIVYAAAAISVAARLFGAEAVLYSEQGQWSETFRRPRHHSDAAPRSAALLCLAVLFPAYFLATGGLSWLGRTLELPIPYRLAMSGVTAVVLFLGVPLAFALYGRVRLATGFGLAGFSPWAVLGAMLIGASAWPWISEIVVLLERNEWTTIPGSVRDAVRNAVVEWRRYPAVVLLVSAVIPAVVEELFFRGYLFAMLERSHSRRVAVAGSAAVFAVFHVLVGEALGVERVIPSLLMGLVLGWVRLKAGSVIPGMALHLLHNGLLLSLALFPGLLGSKMHEVTEGEGHVPWAWLGASAAALAVGAGLIWLGRTVPSSIQGPADDS